MTVRRKMVTVLFADVAESTGLGERLDAESVRSAMLRWFAEARAVIERHGGTVEKFIGDAVMAVFGVPRVHEDDAARAVRAAAGLYEALEVVNDELEREGGVRLAIRVGVNTGEVVAGEGDVLVTGDAVNVAKRLEEAARPGEVLVGSATERLARTRASFELVEPLAAKGKSAPVEAWRLVDAVHDGAARAVREDVAFVGRQHELRKLRAAFDHVVSDQVCHRLTLLGPAGIGKSRLACELFDDVGTEATVVSGRCLPYGDGITWWPIADIIRRLGGIEKLPELLAGSDDADSLVERLRGIVGAGPTSGGQETFWAVRRLFEALARRRPLVLCFEDVHWAEPTFLDLLEYLTGWVGDAPLLLLCLARPELLDERPGWVSGDGVASLSLQPLSSDESQELVSMLGVGEAMWRKIVEAAEGNPLYAEQMAAMLADGPYADEFVTMPPTIHALLAARLDRLPPSERKGLERAAVTGKEFWRGAVVELTPAADRDQVGQALMALVRKDLIRPHRATMGADDAFRFAHALIRDAAYGAIPKQERAALHAAFANWLQANVNAHAGELEEVVGYHLEQAFWYRQQVAPADEAARGLAERAGELLGRCGQRAFARDDIPAAVNLLDRALALLTDEAPAAVELQRQLSLALWSNGEVARSEALLDGVIAAASAAGDRATEWYCLLERNGRRAMTDPWADAAEILEVCRDAVSIYDELGDDRGLARAWRQIATTNQAIGNFGAAVDASERALEHARTAGDTREESRSADALCTGLLYGPTPAEEAIHRCEDLLRRADGNPLLEANVRISLAGLTAMRGMFDDARATADSARKTYAELGLRLAAAGADQVAAALELLAGDGAAAERILRDSYDILRDVGAEGFSLALLADALYEQGRYEEAEELSVEGLGAVHDDDAVPQVIWRGVRAKLAARTFDSDAALELANAALRCAEETDSLNLRGDACANLAETLRLLGRNDDAARAAGRAQVTYERKGNVVAARRASTLLANAMQR